MKNESLQNQSLETENSKSNSKVHNEIIAQPILGELKKMKMSKQDKMRALNMTYFIDGLIPVGYHIILYGAAGSGKTTIALHWCFEIVQKFHDVIVFYLYLDGQLGMAANYENFLEGKNVVERYNLLTNCNVNDTFNLIEKSVSAGEILPENILVVLDTLKYLNPNINNKDANVKAMQRIKKLTALGITFISLHHTNKDGENYAGTAEIEQDGDGLLKIETTQGDDKYSKLSTIDEGGRVRFFMKSRSYKFIQGKPQSVEEMSELIDAKKILLQKRDESAISIIKNILESNGELNKTELCKLLNEDDRFNCKERERNRILSTYTDKHWKITKGGERNIYH